MKLPVTWEVCGYIDVPADTIEEAIEYFKENCDYIKLPDDGEYVDGSFSLTTDDLEELEALCNI